MSSSERGYTNAEASSRAFSAEIIPLNRHQRRAIGSHLPRKVGTVAKPANPMAAAMEWSDTHKVRVFPTRNKKPRTGGDWRVLASSDPIAIMVMDWAEADGFGVALDDHVVLDLDVGNAPLPDVQAELDRLAPDAEPTLVVETPSGGRHLYFAAPEGVALSQRSPAPGKIDIRIPGKGYVCGPGVGGYRVLDDREVAELPRSIRDMAETVAPQSEITSAADALTDGRPTTSEDAWALVTKHAERIRAAEPGARNDTANAEAFQAGRAFPVLQDELDKVVEVLVDAATSTGLDDDETRPVVFRALAKGARSRMPVSRRPDPDETKRSLLEAAAAAAQAETDWLIERVKEASPSERVEVIKALEAKAMADAGAALLNDVLVDTRVMPPPQEYLVEGFVPANTLTSLYGDGGAGKTLFAIQLAICIATGTRFLGMRVTQAPAVLYLCEDTVSEIQRRIHDVAQALGLPLGPIPDLHIATPTAEMFLYAADNGGTGGFTTTFKALVAKADAVGARFIGIDNAAAAFGANENDRKPVGEFLRELQRRAADEGRSYYLLGHPPKGGARSSGSTSWRNVPRGLFWFQRDVDDAGNRLPTNTVSTDKRNLAGLIDEPMTLYFDRGSFTVDEASPAAVAARAKDEERQAREREIIERGLAILYHKGVFCARSGPSAIGVMFKRHGLLGGMTEAGLKAAVDRGIHGTNGWLRADVHKPAEHVKKNAAKQCLFATAYTTAKAGVVTINDEAVPSLDDLDPEGRISRPGDGGGLLPDARALDD